MRTRIALVLLAAIALAVAAWLAAVDIRERRAGASPSRPVRGSVASAGAASAANATDAGDEEPAAPERRAEARVDAIECRVLREGTREPLAGFSIAMRSGGELVAERMSDARGACTLPRPMERAVVVRVEAPWGWVVREPSRAIEPGGEAPARLEFLARPAGFARWRARLVDDDTLEPVPRYMLHLGTRDGQREELTSDGEGRIESQREYAEATLLVWGYDVIGPDPSPFEQRPDFYREVEHRVVAGESVEVELAVPVGPTYRLALDAPPKTDLARLTAGLWLAPPGRSLPPEKGSVPVRWDDGPWVRFEPRSRSYTSEPASRYLLVVSADGLACGGAAVESARGVLRRVVPISLEGRARVVGRAVDPQGEPVARASIQLAPRVPGLPSAVVASAESSGNGVFEFRGLALGAYEILALSAAHERRSIVLDVALAERVDVEIVLPLARDAGSVSGRLVASLDAERRVFDVSLTSTRPAGRRLTQRVEMHAGEDSLRGEFRFDHVADGDWRLTAESFGVIESWQPPSIAVAPPAANLELRLVRRSDERTIACRVVDARTGESVATAWARIDSPAGWLWPFPVESESDRMSLSGGFGPEDRWWVSAPGYATYSGSPARDFELDGEVWLAKVALERGFAVEIEVIGPREAPITGAEVWLDGERAAVSDASGRAVARRERAPASIELRYGDWIVEPGDRAVLIDALAGSHPRPRIRMSPP